MIELRVKEYCHNCPDFEADVDKDILTMTSDDPYQFNSINKKIVRTTVLCKHRYRCESVKDYLNTQNKPEEENKNG